MPFLTFLASSGFPHSLTESVHKAIPGQPTAVDGGLHLWEVSRNGSNLSGNKRKGQFKHPASGKVTQREAQPFTQPQNARKIGSLATEEDPMQRAGSFRSFPWTGWGGKHASTAPTLAALRQLLLSEPHCHALEDNGCVYWPCPGQSSLIIHFWITDRRVLAAMATTKSPYLLKKKKVSRRCGHFSRMWNSWQKLCMCESEMWMGGEKRSLKYSL